MLYILTLLFLFLSSFVSDYMLHAKYKTFLLINWKFCIFFHMTINAYKYIFFNSWQLWELQLCIYIYTYKKCLVIPFFYSKFQVILKLYNKKNRENCMNISLVLYCITLTKKKSHNKLKNICFINQIEFKVAFVVV